ncbi:MAG: class I SAM-dependent methyltransferase [Desulfobacteraceae bacterium]|nr:class I SAM-dependent methyltransferase [Desulfobacteraceae bacterium]
MTEVKDQIVPGDIICPDCSDSMRLVADRIYDTKYGVPGEYSFYRCQSCQMVRIHPILSDRDLKQIYEKYYNFGGKTSKRYTRVRKYFINSKLYQLWMKIDGDICFHSYKGTGRLIDIGCNEGKGIEIYSKNGFDVEGFEINKNAAEIAKRKGFEVYTGNLETFSSPKHYDIAVLSHVLEHSKNPENMILNISKILKPKGLLLISVPNIKSWQKNLFRNYWTCWHVPYHIFFFSAHTIAMVLKRCGFKVKRIKNYSPALWVAQSTISLIFSKYSKTNAAQQSSILLGSLMLFVRFFLFSILWLGNIAGHGDCLIIEAEKENPLN